MPTNKDRSLSAAVTLLAEEGIRSLTHLRIDERAGLPQGSTSNAFRTRNALLLGVTEYMVGAELPSIEMSFNAPNAEVLVDSLVELFSYLIGPGRTVTAARLALIVESSHDDAVREALAKGRATITDPVFAAFTELGAPDPAFAVQLISICFEGLFLNVIGHRADIDPRPIIQATVHAGLELS